MSVTDYTKRFLKGLVPMLQKFIRDFIQEIIDCVKKPDEEDPMRHKLHEESPEKNSG